MSRRCGALALLFLLAARCGGDDSPPAADLETVREWNRVAIDASGLDHTPPADGEDRIAQQQFGPGRAGRAMAIAHIAMSDALATIAGTHRTYSTLPPAPRGASPNAAVAQAAHDTLVALFSAQTAIFDDALASSLAAISDPDARQKGVAVGAAAAAAILADRTGDGSETPEPTMGEGYIPSSAPGKWRMDPVSPKPIAMGAYWGEVRPFALGSGSQYRVPPPPAMESDAYTTAYDEVRRLGGDGVVTTTERTAEQTTIGIYWAYDGTPTLCAPPRLYNQIVTQLAKERGVGAVELARLLALANVAMADAGIAIWDSKYFHDVWRPVTGIRESDPGSGPTGLGDGNPRTVGDPSFTPLGAPASNLAGSNFTPPFPAYPSGHAGFGGAVFQVLRDYFGTDDISFAFVSDEWNGVTLDFAGAVRPLVPRFFHSLSEAEEENGQSRIYLGIHWSFDKTAGIAQGRQVGDHVFRTLFLPVGSPPPSRSW